MSNIDMKRRCEVMLAIQQALLGEVSKNLRAVTLSYTEDSFHFDAYFDGDIDAEDRDSMSIVETEIMATFPSNHSITHDVIRLDAPALIPKDCIWAYFRKE